MNVSFTPSQGSDGSQNTRLSNMVSREVFVQLVNKNKRVQKDSIFNESKQNEKITHDDQLTKQDHTMKSLPNQINNSSKTVKNNHMTTEFTMATLSQYSPLKISRFADEKQQFQQSSKENAYKTLGNGKHSYVFPNTQQPQPPRGVGFIEEQKSMISIQQNSNSNLNKKELLSVNKIKKRNIKSLKSNRLLSEINTKIREIDIISKTFDQVNSSYNIDLNFNHESYYEPQKKLNQSNLLKEFQSKLMHKKNLITLRRNSLKKNVIVDYRYKAFPKRFRTELEKENTEGKYSGLWNEDAKKMKNYILGGYAIQKEEYSDHCDLEDFRKLKKNFRSFDQIYSSIKEDKGNPIGKMIKTNGKNPSILEIVCNMEKIQEKHDLNNCKPQL